MELTEKKKTAGRKKVVSAGEEKRDEILSSGGKRMEIVKKSLVYAFENLSAIFAKVNARVILKKLNFKKNSAESNKVPHAEFKTVQKRVRGEEVGDEVAGDEERKPPWFRIFVDRSALTVISIIIGINLIPFVQSVFMPPSLDSMVKKYFVSSGARNLPEKDIAYEIDDAKYSLTQLNSLFSDIMILQYGTKGALRYQNNRDAQLFFIQRNFETDLLVQQAMKENTLGSPDLQRLLSYYLKERIAELFVYHRIKNDMSDFENPVTDEEVLRFYKENKKMYDAKHVSEKIALKAIRETLNNVRRQQSAELIGRLRGKLIEDLEREKKVHAPSANF